jgi:hypothetical protein
MNPALAGAIYDDLLPGWRDARLVSGNRRIKCPFHDDQDPSFDIHEENLVWICRSGCGGGGAWDLAVRFLGEDEARELVGQLSVEIEGGRTTPASAIQKAPLLQPRDEVEVIGDPPPAQIAALMSSRRLRHGKTLTRIGAKLVRWCGREWLGFPTIVEGSWKLWALDSDGCSRLEGSGSLIRRNVGEVSLVVSPALHEHSGAQILRLYDVEGESDLLAAVEAGISRHHVHRRRFVDEGARAIRCRA